MSVEHLCWVDHFIPYDIHTAFEDPHGTAKRSATAIVPEPGCSCGCPCTSACAPDCGSCTCVFFLDIADAAGDDAARVPCHVDDDYQPPLTVVSTPRNGWVR